MKDGLMLTTAVLVTGEETNMEPQLKIFYLHGFAVKNSLAKPHALKVMYPNANVIAIDYDPHKPFEAQARILDAIDNNSSIADEVLVVGTSLGGFWTRWVTEVREDVKGLLINPQLRPQLLEPGLYSYYGTEIEFNVTKADIEAFKHFDCKGGYYDTAISVDDEIIDLEHLITYLELENRGWITYENQGHRFSNINILKPQIDMLLNTFPI